MKIKLLKIICMDLYGNVYIEVGDYINIINKFKKGVLKMISVYKDKMEFEDCKHTKIVERGNCY